jgi:cysteine desulfurase
MNKDLIYFDNNATTRLDKEVFAALSQTYSHPLNASSIHKFGNIAQKYVKNAKENISKYLNTDNYEIIFTSGATESNNMAIQGFKDYEIITSAIEHSSILQLAQKNKHHIIDVDNDGVIKIEQLEDKLKNIGHGNFLVSIMMAHNETGVIQPIAQIAKLVHQYGGLIHSDITQGVGKIEINIEKLNIDLASFSAHKINGPQGIGALLLRKSLEIDNLIYGGSQIDEKRPGTLNIAGIVGMGKAFEILKSNILSKNKDILQLRDYLEKKMVEIAKDNVVIFGKNAQRLPNTSFFATKNIDNQTLLMIMDLENIAISSGSACSAGVNKISSSLKAMKINDKLAKCAIRISLGFDNNKEQIDKFLQIWQSLYLKKNNKIN